MQVKQLRSLGQDPYAYRFDRTHTAAQLQHEFESLPSGQVAEDAGSVSIAGRVRARRFMGKLAFATLADDSGEIQLYLEKTSLDAAAPDSFKYIASYQVLTHRIHLTHVSCLIACKFQLRLRHLELCFLSPIVLHALCHSMNLMWHAVEPLMYMNL